MKKELVEFIVEAKRNTYADKNNQAGSSRNGSIDYEYSKGDYRYLDSYIGSSYFSGEEIVWEKDIPVWSMNYYGQVFKEGFSGDFLKESLKQNSFDRPYRGPSMYKSGDYTYLCNVEGDIDKFEGREMIFYKDVHIYNLVFHGGIIN